MSDACPNGHEYPSDPKRDDMGHRRCVTCLRAKWRRQYRSRRNKLMPTINLPYPPTANHIWIRARKGMRKSDEYKAWLDNTARQVATNYPDLRVVAGPYALTIDAVRPDKRKRDLDNLIKPISDALVKVGAISDDSLCASLSARWVKGESGVRVTIEPAEAA